MSFTLNITTAAEVPADAPRPGPHETDWYTGHQQPVQIGVYARLTVTLQVMYSLWDGAHWRWNCRHPVQAARVPAAQLSLVQALPWRGLRQPPAQGYGLRPATHTAAADQALDMGVTC